MDQIAELWLEIPNREANFLYALIAVVALTVLSSLALEKRAKLTGSASFAIAAVLMVAGLWLVLMPSSPSDGFGRSKSISWLRDVDWPQKDSQLSAIIPGFMLSILYIIRAFFGAAVIMLGVPFIIMLYRKWFGGQLSPAEQTPGIPAWRAWFSTLNVVWAATVACGLWLYMDYTLLTSIIIMGLLLGAYPAYLWATKFDDDPVADDAVPEQQPTETRTSVLRMIEAGRISAEEGSMLLDALPVPRYARSVSATGRSRKFMLMAASVIALSFMMPWVRFDLAPYLNPETPVRISADSSHWNVLAKERAVRVARLTSIMNDIGLDMETDHPMVTESSAITVYGTSLTIGWLFLWVSAASLCLSLVPNEIPPGTRRTLQLIGVISGVVLLLQPVDWGVQILGPGYYMAAAGLVLMALAILANLENRSDIRIA